MKFFVLLVDLTLLGVMISFFITGARRGFWVTLGTLAGFLGGATLSFFSIPKVSSWVTDPYWRLGVVITVAILLIVMGQAVGAWLGRIIRLRLNIPQLRWADRLAGGVMNALVAVVAYAVIAFSLSSLGIAGLTEGIRESRVVSTINLLAPKQMKSWLADMRAAVQGSPLPELVEPIFPNIQQHDAGEKTQLNEQALKSRVSVMRITGTATECGQNQYGTGVAVTPTHVVTNAHVVSGVAEPIVEPYSGEVKTAQVVYFDSALDVAVLYVPDGNFTPIKRGSKIQPGGRGAIMGYPAGGPFDISSAVVEGSGPVAVPNIYGAAGRKSVIYQFSGRIRHGNSGGPLVNERGEMVGLVFAKAQGSDTTGYALSMQELAPVLKQGTHATRPVSSGQCLPAAG